MRSKIFIPVILWILVIRTNVFAQDFKWVDISNGNPGIRVLLASTDGSKIFAGGCGGLWKSWNAGKDWRRVLRFNAGSEGVNALAFGHSGPVTVYAATEKGLYRSVDSGEHWQRIFKGRNDPENRCIAVSDVRGTIFLGTQSGLLISRDGGRVWSRQKGRFDNYPVFNIDSGIEKGCPVYVSSCDGIFRSIDGGQGWDRVYAGLVHNEEPSVEEEGEESETEGCETRFVKVDTRKKDLVYFCGTKGVCESSDQGNSWSRMPEYGLLKRDVKMICLEGDSTILALTRRGIFRYRDERWIEVSIGLSAGRLNYLSLDEKGNIYVAAEKGMFRCEPVDPQTGARRVFLREYLEGEPEISDLQEAAIEYAEVSFEKISRWRNLASKKAFLPKLSVGLDRNSTDLWHWESGSSAIGQSGDDLLRKGKDSLDWDITLSWELGDLIWNDDQTSIDVRSKLMVELRNDILDELNKLYFERLRIKSELDSLSIEDRRKRFDKELKLAELTASLDSLTAGYFSKQLRLNATNN
ncbi:MAG: hypothetical protein PHW98_04625 [Candidatus Omnitrophica bacterium]|nr:hypothetical protein [Candidatus Omnitrophota bacterium]MDD5771119.1 hypothetical protein [Candidatus Omnitrophota bacterium]